jgi:hypothetical protein
MPPALVREGGSKRGREKGGIEGKTEGRREGKRGLRGSDG